MRGSWRRPGAAATVLLLAVLALAAVVAVRPPHAPPLYDGLGFPDEPYRWVSASSSGLRPTAASASLPVGDGRTPAGQATSAEQGPQVAVAVGDAAFAVPAGVRAVGLRAEPRAVPSTPPEHGQVVSNLYALTADAGGRPVPLAAGQTVLVNMRAEAATQQAVVICRWTGRRWEQVPTQQVGVDIYAARLSALGAVAVVRLDAGVSPTVSALADPSSSGGATPPTAAVGATPLTGAPGDGPAAPLLLLVLGGVVVVLVTGLLVVRRRAGVSGERDSRAQPGPAA